MQLKLTIVLLALCTFGSGSNIKSAKNHFSKLLLQSRTAIEDNPSRSIICFSDYIDEINEVTTVYEEDLGQCKSESEDAQAALDAAFAGDRADLAAAAVSACKLFTDCNANEHASEFFTCYATAVS